MIRRTGQVNQAKTITRQDIALQSVAQGGNFQELLHSKLEQTGELTFSRHAAQRIEDRGICMDDTMFSKLSEAVDKAGSKGSKNVAVIAPQGVFIVNVPNKVVVTGVSLEEMKENIVTNIDSAVLL